MSPADVLSAKRKVPFEPFRIVLTDGRTFDVRHSDFCMVLPSVVLVGVMKREDDELPERVARIHPSQLHNLVPLGSPVQGGGAGVNGTTGT